jgi:hypothetical protein
MFTEQLTQCLSIAASPINPASINTGDADTGGIDMSKFRRALFVLHVGAFGADATVDAKIQESADNSNWDDHPGPNAAITQLAAADGDNRLVTLEIRSDQLSAGKRYARVRVTVGTAATILSCLPLAGETPNKPAKQHNITAVAEQKVVG